MCFDLFLKGTGPRQKWSEDTTRLVQEHFQKCTEGNRSHGTLPGRFLVNKAFLS